MRNDTFKRRPAFSLTVTISAQKYFLLLEKPFTTTALEYKAILQFKNDLYALLHIP